MQVRGIEFREGMRMNGSTARNDRTVIFNNMITPYSNRLYNEVCSRGRDIAVVSCTNQEANRAWADTINPGYRHQIIPGVSIRLDEARFVHVNAGIFRVLRDLRPARVIVCGFYPSMLGAALWAFKNRTPMALVTDGWSSTMPNSIYHSATRSFVFRQSRAVACCGRKGADYLRGQGISQDRIVVVPLVPGWDPPRCIPTGAKRRFDLLWCAQMNDKRKNLSFFLDVVLALHARMPGLQVRLVGTGSAERRAIARLRAAGIAFEHQPQVAWTDMADVFTSARLLLLPSRWEPWGLVCNEAMQCGTVPIVSELVGAADDLVLSGENGIVRPLKQEDWVDVIEHLSSDEAEWNRLSYNARAAATSRTVRDSACAFDRFIALV
jgi:glycosyltransferase involved in cell wall biosynthesis